MRTTGSLPAMQKHNTPHDRAGKRPATLVLTGGQSRRMGAPKPLVPLYGKPLIAHVIDRLLPILHPVYIVARDPTGLSHLGVPVLQDLGPHSGPLMGLYSGLAQSGAQWCFAVGCDMPFLSAVVVQHMITFLDSADIVIARINGRLQPLHAFYSVRCLSSAKELLDHGNGSLMALVESQRTTVIEEQDILHLDPELRSFLDLDTPQQVASFNQTSFR